jgi:hypothetical protein
MVWRAFSVGPREIDLVQPRVIMLAGEGHELGEKRVALLAPEGISDVQLVRRGLPARALQD